MELVHWIDINKLPFRWNLICQNENAINLIEKVLEEGLNSSKLPLRWYNTYLDENYISFIEKK